MFSPIAEVNLQNLSHNCNYIRTLVGNRKIFPVIKANAYGHGLESIAQFLNKSKVIDGFCVATPLEAEIVLSQNIYKPIFILGKFDFNNLALLNNENVIPTIHSFDDLLAIKSLEKSISNRDYQLKFDTGMGRMGFELEDLSKVIDEVINANLNLVGLWSHLSSADENNQEYTNQQIKQFENILSQLQKKNIFPQFNHIANSSAILLNKKSYFNTVRPGIAIFGVSPNCEINSNLKPVMKYKLPLIKIKTCKSEKNIGYNQIYKSRENELIGIFQGGYADGVSTIFNNNGNLRFDNSLLPIRGKISMDMLAAEITTSSIKIGDYATLWGENDLVIEYLAKKYNKNPYEFLVNLSDRVERKYFE